VRPDEHIWLPSSGPGTVASSSRDTECYVGERDCRKVGDKQSCAACHIVAHSACLPLLYQLHMTCKTTYWEESPVKKQTEAGSDGPLTRHHWVHKWKHEGRCLRCGKSFQQKIFREKVIAFSLFLYIKKSLSHYHFFHV
ncbi:unnamed protein product, partial [Gongylonema pulchrum]|uniref:Phorbol-ester/DAG-type domain-containing protein n=1 Tax=Gongylonema pulchrum TaxID=637853 RepID=A0A183DDF3_9BILA